MSDRKSVIARLRDRVRHGLLTQEVLDRLGRMGINIYPYFLVHESCTERPDVERQAEGFSVRFLGRDELHQVSEVPARPLGMSRLEARMEKGGCFGVWEGSALAAYSWYSLEHIPAAVGGYPLCSLPPGTAYLYDAYVLPEYRGRRIAPYMRHMLYNQLREEGIDQFFSITLAFNRSSRRFKARLGAEEFETRLLLGVGRIGGMDIRLSSSRQVVATPRAMRLRRDAARSRD